MYLKGLDELDRKIVALLTENARMSYSDIGEAVGVSRVAVRARIDALEKRGVIEGYTTIINPQKIGSAVSAYFEIETEPAQLQPVAEALDRCDTVTQIYFVSAAASCTSTPSPPAARRWNGFLQEFLYRLPGVVKLSCNIILSRKKDVKGLRL